MYPFLRIEMAIQANLPASGAVFAGDFASTGGVKREADGPAERQRAEKVAKTEEEKKFDHRKLMKEGQKQLTPPVADATRGFYSSLLAENPNSKIAIKYCIEYGILPIEDHKKLLKKYNALKEKGAFDPRKRASLSVDQMKKADKKKNPDGKKDKKDKEAKEGNEKKEKKGKDGKEKKEKKDKREKDGKIVPSASP